MWLLHNPGASGGRSEKPSPYFLADRFALGSFPCALFRLGLVFAFLFFWFCFFFNVPPRFPSYLTPVKGQRGKFHFPGSISRVIPGLSKHFPEFFLRRFLQIPTASHSEQQIPESGITAELLSALLQMPAEHCRGSPSLRALSHQHFSSGNNLLSPA